MKRPLDRQPCSMYPQNPLLTLCFIFIFSMEVLGFNFPLQFDISQKGTRLAFDAADIVGRITLIRLGLVK